MDNVITLSLLEDKGACDEQRDKFVELFGKSVVVTRELALEHADAFDWFWAAEELLTNTAYDAFMVTYHEVAKEHETAVAPFAETYTSARDAAWAAFDRATGVDHVARHGARVAAITAAYAVYQTAVAPFEAAYRRAQAAAFADAFLSPANRNAE